MPKYLKKFFVGVDVQVKKGCCYYILDEDKQYVDSGWIYKDTSSTLKNIFLELSNHNLNSIYIGIDAPRMPLKNYRNKVYDKKNQTWLHTNKKLLGRECEVLIKSYNLGNPQWTKFLKDSPEWMKLGYAIFNELENFPHVYEVFPSASYKMLCCENIKYELCLNDFYYGIKDMLDASVASFTVYEFISGRGCEVGGSDGMGTIILPRKIIF